MKPTPPTPKNEYCIKNSQLENAFIDKMQRYRCIYQSEK